MKHPVFGLSLSVFTCISMDREMYCFPDKIYREPLPTENAIPQLTLHAHHTVHIKINLAF